MHDLKHAFGSPDPNFQRRVRQTLLSIEAREQAAERKKKNRFSLSFALSAVLCVALLAAFVVSLSNSVKRGRPDTTNPLSQGEQTGMTVYISEGDPCFHFFLECPDAKTGDMRAIPVEQAFASDKTPCTGCFGKADEPVYIDPVRRYYHATTCTGHATEEEHTLTDALKAGMAPCPLCVMSENCSIHLLGNTEVYIETSAEGKRTCHLKHDWEQSEQRPTVFTTHKYSEIYLNPSAYSDLTYCSACFGRLRDNTVYLTEDDPYYHSDETHADAAHPVALDVSVALVLGKLPCPVCVINQAEVTETVLPTVEPTPMPTDYAESTLVPLPTAAATVAPLSAGSYAYIGEDSTFHISEECARLSEQSERYQMPIKDAINAKLTPCVNCFGDSQIDCYLDHAHMYYHHNANCAGAVANNRYSLEITLNNGYLPCPLCVMNINVADSLFEDASVYASTTDEFFHSVITCSAIQDASYVQPHPIVKLLLASGMTPCPLCMGDNMADEYVMSAYDNYYHSTAYCTRLQNVNVNDRDSMPTYDIAFALSLGMLPCPDCILAAAGIDYEDSETADVMVQFSNLSMCYTSVEDPHYYHKTATCPQMPGDVYSYLSEEDALAIGLSRCPVCYDIPSDEPAATLELLNEPIYYDTPYGEHYHIDPYCTGMKNAEPVSLEEALARGQTPCPYCISGAENSSEASDSNAGTAAGR